LSQPASPAPKRRPLTQRVLARLDGDHLTLRLDAAGGLLHKRGWRTTDGPAPIRPTLASACLAALNWSPHEPLLDPMCGAGTFTIEAARAALALPPRLTGPKGDPLACQHWPHFEADLWHTARRTPPPWPWGEPTQSAPIAGALASDLSARSLELTRTHLALALSDLTDPTNHNGAPTEHTTLWRVARAPTDATTALPELLKGAGEAPSGLVIVNPPYNLRVSGGGAAPGETGDAARELLRALKHHLPPGWRAGVLLPTDYPITPPSTLSCDPALRFSHGGLPVTLWRLQRT
jgi:putative N6-adenine-specific DNA methylase